MVDNHTPSSGNVFADINHPRPNEALILSQLAAILQKDMTDLKLTQEDISKRVGISQPKLSNILRGQFNGISRTYILKILRKLGHDIDVVIKPIASSGGLITVVADLVE